MAESDESGPPWVPFRQLATKPAAHGLCLLVPKPDDHDPKQVLTEFVHDYQISVLLVTDKAALNETSDLTASRSDEVELALSLGKVIADLLPCVSSFGHIHRIDPANKKLTEIWIDEVHPECSVDEVDVESLDANLVVVVAHGSSEEGTIGNLVPEALDRLLGNASEVLVLACGSSCPDIGKPLSENRTVIACISAIDSRAAMMFGINYLWKRFGDGVSPAQAIGAANVVLPNDPFQLWRDGVVM